MAYKLLDARHTEQQKELSRIQHNWIQGNLHTLIGTTYNRYNNNYDICKIDTFTIDVEEYNSVESWIRGDVGTLLAHGIDPDTTEFEHLQFKSSRLNFQTEVVIATCHTEDGQKFLVDWYPRGYEETLRLLHLPPVLAPFQRTDRMYVNKDKTNSLAARGFHIRQRTGSDDVLLTHVKSNPAGSTTTKQSVLTKEEVTELQQLLTRYTLWEDLNELVPNTPPATPL